MGLGKRLRKLKKAVRKVVKVVGPVAAGFIPGGQLALTAIDTVNSARQARKANKRERANYERALRAADVPDMVAERDTARVARRRGRFGITRRANALRGRRRLARRKQYFEAVGR